MILEAVQITKQYQTNPNSKRTTYALQTTNLQLTSGKLTILTGKSGSGKTTLLHILAGLLHPTSGYVELDGHDIYNMSDKEQSAFRNKNIAIIPQGEAAIHSLTALENILLAQSIYGANPDTQAALQLLQELDIASIADMYPSELSGGELKRVSIARGLFQNAGVLLADEPTADLDEENSRIVIQALQKEARKGKAVLVVTHELDLLPYADEHYIMQDGKLTQA